MTDGLLSPLREFAGNRRGSIAIVSVFVFVLMCGLAGLVVDVAQARNEKNHLLTVAEAAAIAAASHAAGGDLAGARAAAKSYAAKNRPNIANVVTDAEIEFGKWENGTFAVDEKVSAVRVTASRTDVKSNATKTVFAHMFGTQYWNLSASAVAVLDGAPVCILVLHPTHSDAFDVDPGASIDAPGCDVHVNSNSSGALELGSHSNVRVHDVTVVGGVYRSKTAVISPKPLVGAAPMADPYRSLVPPSNNSCGGAKKISDTTETIVPTRAFCDGLTIENAVVTFSPGVYVMKGEFTLKSGASIKGDGVLIYMEGKGSDILFSSKTSFNLKASSSGPYAGIVLWSDKKNTNDHDIYSKFGASAEGTIYTPSSQVEFENDVVWEAPCIRIVVSRLELDNDSAYKSSNTKTKCSNNLNRESVKLVN